MYLQNKQRNSHPIRAGRKGIKHHFEAHTRPKPINREIAFASLAESQRITATAKPDTFYRGCNRVTDQTFAIDIARIATVAKLVQAQESHARIPFGPHVVRAILHSIIRIN